MLYPYWYEAFILSPRWQSTHTGMGAFCVYFEISMGRYQNQVPDSSILPCSPFPHTCSPPTSAQDLFQKMCHKCLSRKGKTAEQGLCWLRTLWMSSSPFLGELKVTNMPSSPMDSWPWGLGKTESLISLPPAESTISIIDLEGMLIGMKWLVVEAKHENEAKTIRNGKQK